MNKFESAKVAEISFSPNCRVNCTDEVIFHQVNRAIRLGLPQVRAYQPNQQTALLVAGGASLYLTERDLIEAYWAGGKVITVNGAYAWCLERNIKPSAQIVIDAREFSTRFVERATPDCNYLLASQCHPRVFELCRDRTVTLWHVVSCGEPELEMLKAFYFGRLSPITLGTTVAVRAISLLRTLGFMKLEIFGLDSCLLHGYDHHAYPQPENDGEPVVPVWIRPEGRDDLAERFLCQPWMAKQALDFLEVTKERGDMFQLNVHGPGLIASMIRLGAEPIIEETGD